MEPHLALWARALYIGGVSTQAPDAAPDPRDALLDQVLRIVPFEGWTDAALEEAARGAGLPDGAGALFFPDGAVGAIRHWNQRTVEAVEQGLAARALGNMGVTARVREGALLALQQIGPNEPAMRRALSRLALPDAGTEGARQLWAVADAIWRGVGDTSTDFNHYTKRAVLSGVLAASVVAWLNDTDADKAEAKAFLDRRLEDVMRFERVKAGARAGRDALAARLPDPAAVLARLRYGSGKGGAGGAGSSNPFASFARGPFGGGASRTVRRRRRMR